MLILKRIEVLRNVEMNQSGRRPIIDRPYVIRQHHPPTDCQCRRNATHSPLHRTRLEEAEISTDTAHARVYAMLYSRYNGSHDKLHKVCEIRLNKCAILF